MLLTFIDDIISYVENNNQAFLKFFMSIMAHII